MESEKVELRRCLKGCDESAKVEARPKGRWRKGDALGLPIFGSPFMADLADVGIASSSGAILTKEGANQPNVNQGSLKHRYVTIVAKAFLDSSLMLSSPRPFKVLV